jgi:glycosyltransferase involved in cell wall biosynthesis
MDLVMDSVQTKPQPKVSIIIPAYNTAELIAGCLDSVFAQTYQNFEAIVVNDGSPDTVQLEQALQPYLDRIVYIRQENKRAAGARNTAIARARGEFLAFLDSDDSWFPHHLASQMAMFEKDPTLDMVYANAILLRDPRGREFMQKCPSVGESCFTAMVVEDCQVSVSTVVVRKRNIVEAGLFDESLARCDDYDMWLRAAFHGAKIAYSRNVQARLNGGRPGSLGGSRVKMAEAYWIILQKLIRTLPLDDSQREVVLKRTAEIKARYLVEEGKCQIYEGRFDKAREFLSEANKSMRQYKVSLALIGLSIAPSITSKLLLLWNRFLNTLYA